MNPGPTSASPTLENRCIEQNICLYTNRIELHTSRIDLHLPNQPDSNTNRIELYTSAYKDVLLASTTSRLSHLKLP